jgi:hypothetical protein
MPELKQNQTSIEPERRWRSREVSVVVIEAGCPLRPDAIHWSSRTVATEENPSGPCLISIASAISRLS